MVDLKVYVFLHSVRNLSPKNRLFFAEEKNPLQPPPPENQMVAVIKERFKNSTKKTV